MALGEHPVDLPQRAPEIVLLVEGVGGDHGVDGPAGGEPQIGELALVAFHRHPFLGGLEPQVGDQVGIGIDRECFRSRQRHRDRVAGEAELEHSSSGRDVAEQVQFLLARDALAIGHARSHGRQCGPPARRPWGPNGATVAMAQD